jgi:peptidyl-tRNA hydrolase, PTH1 family
MSLFSRFRAWIMAEDVAAERGIEDTPEMFDRGRTRIIVGLGNPGRQYAQTRHNFGFFVVDELAQRTNAPTSRKRMNAEVSEARYDGDRLVLVMPQTYMNASGVAVREVMRWYKVPPEDVLIIVDDLDLRYGQVRLRARGGAGGHNGLKSIFQEIGTQEIPRLRVGIGRSGQHAVGHVLSKFTPEERETLPDLIAEAADAAETWLREGTLEAMNQINGKSRQGKQAAILPGDTRRDDPEAGET